MNVALTASITTLPVQLCKTATWDRGKELSGDAHFKSDVGTKVFFADPRSPSQRPSNENTNGLLRQCFQKGTDLSRLSADDLKAVAHTLNYRPRRVLGWKTPAEVFEEQLHSLQRQVELAQFRSIPSGETLAESSIVASVGSRGDSFDNAMAEALNSVYNAELVDRRRWSGLIEVMAETSRCWLPRRKPNQEEPV